MADYVLSNKAEQDLVEIYLFSHLRFGVMKADAYLTALEERFLQLAENPRLGRKVDTIRPGYFRLVHGGHSIFYKLVEPSGVLIVRVLHQHMDAGQHL